MSKKSPNRPGDSIGIPFSVQPDASYFVSSRNKSFDKLKNLIELSDGDVFGVTGVRGAGKSVLLNKVAEHGNAYATFFN